MRYAGVILAAFIVGSLMMPSDAKANCGPFGVWGDNDYCVVCQSATMKINQCPGGDVGQTILGTQFPGCQISYYDSRSCRVTPGLTKKSLDKLEADGNFKKSTK